MKNFKKAIALLLAAVLLVAASVMGTIAYLTDSDGDVNTMVAGNVYIVQNETDRDGKAYANNQKLLPAVYKDFSDTVPAYDLEIADTDKDGTLKIWGNNIENEIDKIISVTNKGTESAFIRTIILFENTADNAICAKLHTREHDDDGQAFKWVMDGAAEDQVNIDGTTYSIAVCTYNTAIEAGATSSPSLMQVFLDPTTDNSWYNLLGDGKLSIIAFSQAVQEAGFEAYGAEAALNEAFGAVTSAKVAEWIDKTGIDTTGGANVIG